MHWLAGASRAYLILPKGRREERVLGRRPTTGANGPSDGSWGDAFLGVLCFRLLAGVSVVVRSRIGCGLFACVEGRGAKRRANSSRLRRRRPVLTMLRVFGSTVHGMLNQQIEFVVSPFCPLGAADCWQQQAQCSRSSPPRRAESRQTE